MHALSLLEKKSNWKVKQPLKWVDWQATRTPLHNVLLLGSMPTISFSTRGLCGSLLECALAECSHVTARNITR